MALVNAFGDIALDATSQAIQTATEATQAAAEGTHTTLNAVINETPGFEKMTVGTVSGRIAANFQGASMPQDGFTVKSTGAGQTVSLAGALNGARYLNIAGGTTINAQTIIESDELVTLPVRVNASVSLSQRIVNHECFLELAGCDGSGVVQEDATGPLNWIAIRWDGTTAANAVVLTRSNGGSVAVSASTAFGTTAATGTGPNFIPAFTYDLLAYAERIIVSGYAVDSLAAPGATAARTTNLPNPLIQYRIRFRVKNGGTAPASTTDFRLHQVRVIDQTRLTAEITGGIGRAADAQSAIPVTGTVALSGGTTAVTGSLTSGGTVTSTPANPTASAINSAAGTNATSVKNAAGNLYSITASNINAAVRYVKLYNKASAPTVGTDVPVITIPIPAGGTVNIPFGTQGYRFATGIALAITTGAADSDTGAVAANEVKILTSYI